MVKKNTKTLTKDISYVHELCYYYYYKQNNNNGNDNHCTWEFISLLFSLVY